MKSRIISQSPSVFALNLSDERFEALNKICGGSAHRIPPEDCGRTVGEICGFSKSAQVSPCEAPPTDECLIFANYKRQELDRLVTALKEAVYVPLKCAATPYNREWTVCELVKELKKEHTAMNGGDSV